MAPSSIVTRPNTIIGSGTSSSTSLDTVQRFTTVSAHGFTEGQVLKRFPAWALASADLEENCSDNIVLKAGPRFFDIAKYDGVYDFTSGGFTNNDRGKTIYLDWRPANAGKMTLEEPPGFEYCQVLGKVVDDGRILIRPERASICGGAGVGIIDINNHGIQKGQIFDRDGNGVKLATSSLAGLFLGNLIAARVTTNRIWYPTTPSEYTINNHGWTVGATYYLGAAGAVTTVPPAAGQNPLRQLPIFVAISADKILYVRVFQPV